MEDIKMKTRDAFHWQESGNFPYLALLHSAQIIFQRASNDVKSELKEIENDCGDNGF